MNLTCPKCMGSMRAYERNGVTVDQCTDCRGIFLDRGELERLIDAEQTWHGAAPAGGPGSYDTGSSYGSPGYGDYDHGSYGSYGKRRKKRSFLEELFD